MLQGQQRRRQHCSTTHPCGLKSVRCWLPSYGKMHNADCRCLKQAVALADPVAAFGTPSVPANECVPDLPQLLVDQ